MRILALLMIMVTAALASHTSPSNAIDKQKTNNEKSIPTTHALLSKLGMKKLKTTTSHHRKRLAESARRRISGDSRMYVIKLPPNQSYYTNSIHDISPGKHLPITIHSNGKPAKIYHWNIPTLEKMASKKHNRPQARLDEPSLDIELTPTWSKYNSYFNSVDFPHYYVPTKNKKTSFRKYYSGNGKPKAFYVIDKSNKTKLHKLLP